MLHEYYWSCCNHFREMFQLLSADVTSIFLVIFPYTPMLSSMLIFVALVFSTCLCGCCSLHVLWQQACFWCQLFQLFLVYVARLSSECCKVSAIFVYVASYFFGCCSVDLTLLQWNPPDVPLKWFSPSRGELPGCSHAHSDLANVADAES
jgi:hypothetical protein